MQALKPGSDEERQRRRLYKLKPTLPLLPRELSMKYVLDESMIYQRNNFHSLMSKNFNGIYQQSGARLGHLPSRVCMWDLEMVLEFWNEFGFRTLAQMFYNEQIDGVAMLLLTPEDIFFRFGLNEDFANAVYSILIVFHFHSTHQPQLHFQANTAAQNNYLLNRDSHLQQMLIARNSAAHNSNSVAHNTNRTFNIAGGSTVGPLTYNISTIVANSNAPGTSAYTIHHYPL